jgi:AraC-like DNA-binding protein
MIGKNRHTERQPANSPPPASAAFRQGCGVLRHSPPPGTYRHLRHAPPESLKDWIEHFWLEEWEFGGNTPQTREILPHPSIQLVFARGRSRIYGVQLGRFVRQLSGNDRILGIKFRPGAFYPFLRQPVCSLANRYIPAAQIFPDAESATEEVLAGRTDLDMVQTATRFLETHLPIRDPLVDSARRAVEEIVENVNVTRVQHLVAHLNTSERAIQRLFRRYVGASPRWVIKRYRIYEALEQLSRGRLPEFATLAQDLGYFDQAHFINDFKKLVGCAPQEYASPVRGRPPC